MSHPTAPPEHGYHLVNPSPWPVLGALSGFVFAIGLLLVMKADYFFVSRADSFRNLGLLPLLPGVALMGATMYFWWRDVLVESAEGSHTPIVQLGLRYGMVLFIASEVMFFVAFFWAFFDASLFPADSFSRVEALGGTWPPQNIETIPAWGLPFVNTVILLLSGVTVTWAHHAILEDKQKDSVVALALTVGLGVLFTAFQAYEYFHASFGLQDGVYASTFYLATGFHGFHVLVGTIFLTVCLVRATQGAFKPNQHFGFEAAAWYWHFVDVVWLFLFCCVYWWGGA